MSSFEALFLEVEKDDEVERVTTGEGFTDIICRSSNL